MMKKSEQRQGSSYRSSRIDGGNNRSGVSRQHASMSPPKKPIQQLQSPSKSKSPARQVKVSKSNKNTSMSHELMLQVVGEGSVSDLNVSSWKGITNKDLVPGPKSAPGQGPLARGKSNERYDKHIRTYFQRRKSNIEVLLTLYCIHA
jgi:hypothetical protein